MAYRIFTDATADLNDELLMGLPNVEIIPMEIMIEGKPYKYGLNEGLTPKQFYSELRSGKFASTSQINPSIYHDYFTKALEEGYDVLYLSFSSGMSSTFTSAELSAIDLREEYPERAIICIDTLCAAMGEGLLVCEAAQRQIAGMELEELAEWVEKSRLKVCHWFTVDTFEHLKHGGRISAATAAIGSTLNIKPLLHVTETGELQAKEKPRGQKQALKAQLKKLDEGWCPEISKRIIVAHGDVLERAIEIRDIIQKKHPDADVQIADMGAVIGAHTGPGVLAIIYWGNNR